MLPYLAHLKWQPFICHYHSILRLGVSDPTSPYYITSVHLPGNSLTKDVLKADNYTIWAQTVTMTLKSYNKMGFLDGTLAKPDKIDPDFAAWNMINSMLVSWIYNSLDPSIKITVSRVTEAQIMWDTLKTRYSTPNGPR